QIGATLGIAVLGSVFNQQLKDKMASALPQSTFSQVPPQLRGGITRLAQDPQAIFSGAAGDMLRKIPAAQRPEFEHIIGMIRAALKPAIADSMHTIFLYALALVLMAVVVSLFMREIPLQKAHEWGQQAKGPRPEVSPEPMA